MPKDKFIYEQEIKVTSTKIWRPSDVYPSWQAVQEALEINLKCNRGNFEIVDFRPVQSQEWFINLNGSSKTGIIVNRAFVNGYLNGSIGGEIRPHFILKPILEPKMMPEWWS